MNKKRKPGPFFEKYGRDVFTGVSLDLPRTIEVDLSKLRSNPEQPRTEFNPVSLEELAASIDRHGLIHPIAVATPAEDSEQFIIVAGERRYRAFKQLGRETIPAIITSGDPDEIALIENTQREDLHPLDEARALTNLMQKHQYRQEDISKIIGKSLTTVNELLRLTTLPEKIQSEFRTSEIPKSTLLQISRLHDPDKQLALWEEAKQGGITVRTARSKKERAGQANNAKHQTDTTLKAGRAFVQKLQKVATKVDGQSVPPLPQLHELRDKIIDLISQLEGKQ